MEHMNMKWRKSSYSGANGGQCVEVGTITDTVVVRDTKDNGTGPVLAVSPTAWKRFAETLKTR